MASGGLRREAAGRHTMGQAPDGVALDSGGGTSSAPEPGEGAGYFCDISTANQNNE